MSTQLVLRAFNLAVRILNAERISLAGTIAHSDRSTQYCSKLFQSRLNELNMRSSTSELGQCWANAPEEAIWSSLKRKTLVSQRIFCSHEAAARKVAHGINIYTQLRSHSTIGMQIPLAYDRSLSRAECALRAYAPGLPSPDFAPHPIHSHLFFNKKSHLAPCQTIVRFFELLPKFCH